MITVYRVLDIVEHQYLHYIGGTKINKERNKILEVHYCSLIEKDTSEEAKKAVENLMWMFMGLRCKEEFEIIKVNVLEKTGY